MALESFIADRPWLAALIWGVLLVGDYYLTLLGAKFARQQQIVDVEGSYELNPYYREDIDSGRRFSSRLIVALLTWGGTLMLLGYLWPRSGFTVAVGALIVLELGVYVRHIDNIATYHDLARNSDAAVGYVRWSRRFAYRRSAMNLAAMALFVLALACLTGSLMLVGGAVGFGLLSVNNVRRAGQLRRAAVSSTTGPERDVGPGADRSIQAQ